MDSGVLKSVEKLTRDFTARDQEMLEATIKVDLNNNKNKNLLCILLTSGRDFRK